MSGGNILGFDHAGTELKYRLEDADIAVVSSLEGLAAAQIGIGHPAPDDESGWQDLLNASPPGSIRVRTSSDGRYRVPHQVTEPGEVVELQLRPSHDDLTFEDLTTIVRELSKQGVALDVARERAPAELAPYFRMPQTSLLDLLALACQGYLVAQWEAGCRAGRIEDSLVNMGWTKLDDEARARLSSSLGSADAKTRVESPDWRPWQRLREAGLTASVVEDEWHADEPTSVVGKLAEIIAQAQPVTDVGMVVDAYLALTSQLGTC